MARGGELINQSSQKIAKKSNENNTRMRITVNDEEKSKDKK